MRTLLPEELPLELPAEGQTRGVGTPALPELELPPGAFPRLPSPGLLRGE
jgi:hypothetical protein